MNNPTSSVAIAMPVFNEADGLEITLGRLDIELSKAGYNAELFIQDDRSTDSTVDVLKNLSGNLKMRVHLESNKQNLGHGPTTWNAYKRAVKANCPIILQLDSDGQYLASELPALIAQVSLSVPVVIGTRQSRADPWFRKVITFVLRGYLRFIFHCKYQDPNSPVRAYDQATLRRFLSLVPEHPLIPNIYLTVIAHRLNTSVIEAPITHRLRQGPSGTGTMWGKTTFSKLLIPRRLIVFIFRAYRELRNFKNSSLD